METMESLRAAFDYECPNCGKHDDWMGVMCIGCGWSPKDEWEDYLANDVCYAGIDDDDEIDFNFPESDLQLNGLEWEPTDDSQCHRPEPSQPSIGGPVIGFLTGFLSEVLGA